MTDKHEIFVKLLAEDVDVWRPVSATQLSDNVFRIDQQPYDRETESWQFEPGETVHCELIDSAGGSMLAAVRHVVG